MFAKPELNPLAKYESTGQLTPILDKVASMYFLVPNGLYLTLVAKPP